VAGYLEVVHDGRIVRYCLIPNKLGQEYQGKDYFPGLQIKASPKLSADGKSFLNPMGDVVLDAVPIAEDDIWCASEDLYTVTGWACYPISFGACKRLPLELIDQVINGLRTEWVSGQPRAAFQINWGGLTIAREYRVLELEAGAAIWPRRALPRWRNYYLMLAPATAEGVKAAPFVTAAVASLTLSAYSVDPKSKALVAGQTAVVHSGTSAVVRVKDVPRLVALTRAGDDGPRHGIMPLLYGPDDGTFQRAEPGRTGRPRSLLSRLTLPVVTTRPETAYLAVDFGTTNTAVALSLRAGAEGEVLAFTQAVLAKKLTDTLDPAFWENARLGFFPMRAEPSNPMPTVLMEMDNRVQPFEGEHALPRYSIDPEVIVNLPLEFIRARHVKQEFKWQDDREGSELRSAFLELLARLVGLQLRLTDRYQGLEKIRAVFTCPLSFSHRQTEQLSEVVGHFKAALEDCGFEVSLRSGLVSESLANLHLIRSRASGGGGHLLEERNVVVDIGGGTTDISVFAGTGEAVWLDSLNIGGRDLAEVFLWKRLRELDSDDERFKAASELLGMRAKAGWLPLDSEYGGKELQHLLLRRFAQTHELAKGFQGAIHGVSADFLTVLLFATGYGVRLASLPSKVAGKEIPPARHIKVWFVGLGSRLFELTPLARATMDRIESARQVLAAACEQLVDSSVPIEFEWQPAGEAKLTVSKGALLVPESAQGLDLQTVVWADVPDILKWDSPYDPNQTKRLTHDARRTVTTTQLVETIGASVDAVVRLLGFTADSNIVGKAKTELQDGYRRGLQKIISDADEAPRHPVVASVVGLKNVLGGVMRRPR
jgi:hypothetical protein